MTTPWPYSVSDAEHFVSEYAPGGWASGEEATWALRSADGSGDILGMIGVRRELGDVGYWLGRRIEGRD